MSNYQSINWDISHKFFNNSSLKNIVRWGYKQKYNKCFELYVENLLTFAWLGYSYKADISISSIAAY
jgi:hypothetical protein